MLTDGRVTLEGEIRLNVLAKVRQAASLAYTWVKTGCSFIYLLMASANKYRKGLQNAFVARSVGHLFNEISH